jgi:hypothetical protein
MRTAFLIFVAAAFASHVTADGHTTSYDDDDDHDDNHHHNDDDDDENWLEAVARGGDQTTGSAFTTGRALFTSAPFLVTEADATIPECEDCEDDCTAAIKSNNRKSEEFANCLLNCGAHVSLCVDPDTLAPLDPAPANCSSYAACFEFFAAVDVTTATAVAPTSTTAGEGTTTTDEEDDDVPSTTTDAEEENEEEENEEEENEEEQNEEEEPTTTSTVTTQRSGPVLDSGATGVVASWMLVAVTVAVSVASVTLPR